MVSSESPRRWSLDFTFSVSSAKSSVLPLRLILTLAHETAEKKPSFFAEERRDKPEVCHPQHSSTRAADHEQTFALRVANESGHYFVLPQLKLSQSDARLAR